MVNNMMLAKSTVLNLHHTFYGLVAVMEMSQAAKSKTRKAKGQNGENR
jgi:hypothetical protein